jgi:hypothetical protein
VQSGGAIYNVGGGTVRQLFIEALSSNTTTQCWDNYSYGSISPGDNLWAEEDGGSLVKFDNTYYTSWKSIVNDVTNALQRVAGVLLPFRLREQLRRSDLGNAAIRI